MTFCNKCGNQLNNGEKFCTKCGAKVETNNDASIKSYEPKRTNDSHKKRNLGIIVGLVVMCIIAVGGIMFFTSNTATVVGKWEVSDRSLGESLSDYPEKNFIIYENGTFTCDGINGTYSINDDTITFSFGWLGTFTYEYKVSRNELGLKNVEHDEKREPIYYDRISK